jgi:hypothetical protein
VATFQEVQTPRMFCSARHGRTDYGVGEEADARRRQDFVSTASRFGTLFGICLLIWLFTGAGSFWPLWVLLFGVVAIGRRAVDTYGRGNRDDAYDQEPASTWR